MIRADEIALDRAQQNLVTTGLWPVPYRREFHATENGYRALDSCPSGVAGGVDPGVRGDELS